MYLSGFLCFFNPAKKMLRLISSVQYLRREETRMNERYMTRQSFKAAAKFRLLFLESKRRETKNERTAQTAHVALPNSIIAAPPQEAPLSFQVVFLCSRFRKIYFAVNKYFTGHF